jgi:hypothetical protein
MFAVFNILSGALICGVGMLFVGLEDLLNPRWDWETLIVACLPAAGVCYALAGGWMLSQARVDLTRGVIWLALAIFFGLAFILGVALLDGPHSETVVFLALFPGCLITIAAVEVAFLAFLSWRQRKILIADRKGLGTA